MLLVRATPQSSPEASYLLSTFFRHQASPSRFRGKNEVRVSYEEFNAGDLRPGMMSNHLFCISMPRQVMDIRAKHVALIDGI